MAKSRHPTSVLCERRLAGRIGDNIPELDLPGEPRYSIAPRILVLAHLIGEVIYLFGVDHGCTTFRDGLVEPIGQCDRLAAASAAHEGSVYRHAATDRRMAGRGVRRRQRLEGRAGRGRRHGGGPGPAPRRGLRRRPGQPRGRRAQRPGHDRRLPGRRGRRADRRAGHRKASRKWPPCATRSAPTATSASTPPPREI